MNNVVKDYWWERLTGEHYAVIYRYALHLSGSKSDAEDIVQETFLKARKAKARPDSDGERRWLYTIARNVVIDKQRWWNRWGNRQGVEFEESQSNESFSEPTTFILKHLKALPLRQREVFVLRHWHGFSTTECAEFLNIGVGSVKSHLSRAIATLKKTILASGESVDNQLGIPNVTYKKVL